MVSGSALGRTKSGLWKIETGLRVKDWAVVVVGWTLVLMAVGVLSR